MSIVFSASSFVQRRGVRRGVDECPGGDDDSRCSHATARYGEGGKERNKSPSSGLHRKYKSNRAYFVDYSCPLATLATLAVIQLLTRGMVQHDIQVYLAPKFTSIRTIETL